MYSHIIRDASWHRTVHWFPSSFSLLSHHLLNSQSRIRNNVPFLDYSWKSVLSMSGLKTRQFAFTGVHQNQKMRVPCAFPPINQCSRFFLHSRLQIHGQGRAFYLWHTNLDSECFFFARGGPSKNRKIWYNATVNLDIVGDDDYDTNYSTIQNMTHTHTHTHTHTWVLLLCKAIMFDRSVVC